MEDLDLDDLEVVLHDLQLSSEELFALRLVFRNETFDQFHHRLAHVEHDLEHPQEGSLAQESFILVLIRRLRLAGGVLHVKAHLVEVSN